ncbi:MAG: hypothetical protein WKF41_05500 [Gaiellaceae bacterium]
MKQPQAEMDVASLASFQSIVSGVDHALYFYIEVVPKVKRKIRKTSRQFDFAARS